MTFRSGARSSGASSSCSSSARSASSSCSSSARSTFAIVAAASCRVPLRCVVSCCRFADARSMCARPPAFGSFRLRSASRIPGAVLRNRSAARSPGRARRSLSFALCSAVSLRLLSASLALNVLNRFGLEAFLLVFRCGFRTARDLLSDDAFAEAGAGSLCRPHRNGSGGDCALLCSASFRLQSSSTPPFVLYARVPPVLLCI